MQKAAFSIDKNQILFHKKMIFS